MSASRPTSNSRHRLREAAGFAAVFANRRVLRGRYFDLHYLLRDGLDAGVPRLGLVVGKKLARQAVLRNLIKRIGREAFRQARPALPPCDVVLRLARPLPAQDAAVRRGWRGEIDELLVKLQARCRQDGAAATPA